MGLVGIEIALKGIHTIKRSEPVISSRHILLWVTPRNDEIHIVIMILLLFLMLLIVVVVHFYKGYFKLIINKAFNSKF